MLSKNMYDVLSCFPKSFSSSIKYEKLLEISKLTKNEIDDCLNETLFPEWNYIRSSNGFRSDSDLFITESGLAKVEEYEQLYEEHKIVKNSLLVTQITMWVSILSAVITLFSLIKMFITECPV